VYVTWDEFNIDLSKFKDRLELHKKMLQFYSEDKPKAVSNWSSQIWPFVHDMRIGDLVILPLKSQPAIQIGEITGDYQFVKKGPDPYFHYRTVRWIGEAIPRSHFSQDLLYSFGAFMTICRIQRNNAEERIAAMRANKWEPETIGAVTKSTTQITDESVEDTNLEELAHDQIALLISTRFKGHNLTRLVEAILKAQGYTTYRSPEGADGGVDILAGAGHLGFAAPRLCVEVKSESSPIDRPTVDKLLGAVQKFGADEGLFVSWGGFKSNVQKELATSFFKMRLWTQKELLEQLFANYDSLDEELKAELPLKRIWTVAALEDE
jgi:restriction system protein